MEEMWIVWNKQHLLVCSHPMQNTRQLGYTKVRTWTENKYKARLVMSYKQRYGVDYTETYSSVCRLWVDSTIDSISSFQQLQDEAILMSKQLFCTFGRNSLHAPTRILWWRCEYGLSAQQSLYGLKQAPRCWSQHSRSRFSGTFNLHPSGSDRCVFIGYLTGPTCVPILPHT
jgi:hypothetical protein